MKKYFLDTEFSEYKKSVKFLGVTLEEINTIDLISIGLFCEDGREYYAINKDFDIKDAWNQYQSYTNPDLAGNKKHYWLRENVLLPIFKELVSKEHAYANQAWYRASVIIPTKDYKFTLKNLKFLVNKYGYSRNEIANDICAFIYGDDCGGSGMSAIEMAMKYEINDKSLLPDLYAYYADYDFVNFCWIFGKMMNLPKGFPHYCKDLKQTEDEIVNYMGVNEFNRLRFISNDSDFSFKEDSLNTFNKKLDMLKCDNGYPKKENEHNALADAKWNHKLFLFLNAIK